MYTVWLCDQNQWKSFHVSDYIKIDQEDGKIPIDHSGKYFDIKDLKDGQS